MAFSKTALTSFLLYSALVTLCRSERSSSDISGFGGPALSSAGRLGAAATDLILRREAHRCAWAAWWRSRD